MAVDAARVDVIAVPVSYLRKFPTHSKTHRYIGVPVRVRGAEVKHAIAEDPDRVDAVPIPVPCHRRIPRQTVCQCDVGIPGRVTVLQVDRPVRWTKDAGGVRITPSFYAEGPRPRYRSVACVTVHP